MNMRVLVADDNVEGADTTGALLRSIGRPTATAYDGVQALACALRQRPSMLLLDLEMPRMDGAEVCRAVRCQPWGGQAFIVGVTGHDPDAEIISRARDAGFDEILLKPVSFEHLAQLAWYGARPGSAG